MSDIQTKITADLGGTLQQLDALKRKIQEINAASSAATRSAKDHQTSLGGVAKAVGKGGGMVGGIFGKVGEAAGMAGPLAPLAAGAAIVGSAFKVLGDISRQLTDTMKAGITSTMLMVNAVRGAQSSRQQGALSAVMSQQGSRRRLMFRGGMSALSYAQGIAQRGGVSNADAMSGVEAAYGASTDAGTQESIAEAAYIIARTGEMGMAEAANALAKNPGARAALANGNNYQAAALVLGGNNPYKTKSALDRLHAATQGGTFKTLDRFQASSNLAEQAVSNDYDAAGVASGEQLGAARSPESAALLKIGQQQLQQLGLMRKSLDSLPRLAKLMEFFSGNRAALDYQAAVEGFAEGSMNYEGGQ